MYLVAHQGYRQPSNAECLPLKIGGHNSISSANDSVTHLDHSPSDSSKNSIIYRSDSREDSVDDPRSSIEQETSRAPNEANADSNDRLIEPSTHFYPLESINGQPFWGEALIFEPVERESLLSRHHGRRESSQMMCEMLEQQPNIEIRHGQPRYETDRVEKHAREEVYDDIESQASMSKIVMQSTMKYPRIYNRHRAQGEQVEKFPTQNYHDIQSNRVDPFRASQTNIQITETPHKSGQCQTQSLSWNDNVHMQNCIPSNPGHHQSVFSQLSGPESIYPETNSTAVQSHDEHGYMSGAQYCSPFNDANHSNSSIEAYPQQEIPTTCGFSIGESENQRTDLENSQEMNQNFYELSDTRFLQENEQHQQQHHQYLKQGPNYFQSCSEFGLGDQPIRHENPSRPQITQASLDLGEFIGHDVYSDYSTPVDYFSQPIPDINIQQSDTLQDTDTEKTYHLLGSSSSKDALSSRYPRAECTELSPGHAQNYQNIESVNTDLLHQANPIPHISSQYDPNEEICDCLLNASDDGEVTEVTSVSSGSIRDDRSETTRKNRLAPVASSSQQTTSKPRCSAETLEKLRDFLERKRNLRERENEAGSSRPIRDDISNFAFPICRPTTSREIGIPRGHRVQGSDPQCDVRLEKSDSRAKEHMKQVRNQPDEFRRLTRSSAKVLSGDISPRMSLKRQETSEIPDERPEKRLAKSQVANRSTR